MRRFKAYFVMSIRKCSAPERNQAITWVPSDIVPEIITYIALGSNLGNRLQHLQTAVEEMAAHAFKER